MGDEVRDAVLRLATKFHAGIEALAALDAPVISAVRGAAAGGGMSLAISADIVLAAESARFTMAYTAIGFSPDGGSSWTLPRLVGPRRAAELMLLNERLEPEAARELGLVNRVVADDALDAEADSAGAAARGRPDAPRTAASSGCCARPGPRDFHEQLAEEARTIAGLAGEPDRPRGRRGVPREACATLESVMTDTVHIPVDEAGPTVSDVMMRGARDRRAGDATRRGPRGLRQPAQETAAGDRRRALPRHARRRTTCRPRATGRSSRTCAPTRRASRPTTRSSRALEIVESEGLTRIPVVDDGRPAAGPGLLQRLARGVLHLPL